MVGLAIPCLPAMHHHDTAPSQALSVPPPRPWEGARLGVWYIVNITMVIRLFVAMQHTTSH